MIFAHQSDHILDQVPLQLLTQVKNQVKVKRKMNIVHILLTNTKSMLSRSIQLFTNDPYNHVSLVLNDDFTEIYSFGRLKKENPVNGGFVNEFETKESITKVVGIRN